ncbi:YkvA family protein [Bacillus spongiae]|uniref:YkvA family protein n=1 Tax=Bacillus spongiae TaxID=2683610 RepID=A0ABU8HE53_9BACI
MKKEVINSEEYFSEKKFWTKLKRYSKKAGASVVYAALLLYYTLQKPEVPKKVKATIIAALGYFILPTDLIPDLLIGIGYTDDLGALSVALVQVAIYMDDEVKGKAKIKLEEWFGRGVDTSQVDKKIEHE